MTTLSLPRSQPIQTTVRDQPSAGFPAAMEIPAASPAAASAAWGQLCRNLYGPDSVAPHTPSVYLALWFRILLRQVAGGATGPALYVAEVYGPHDTLVYRTRRLSGYGAAQRLAEAHVAACVDQLLYRFVGSEQPSALYTAQS